MGPFGAGMTLLTRFGKAAGEHRDGISSTRKRESTNMVPACASVLERALTDSYTSGRPFKPSQ